jgi:monothiol glutaredoxin
MTDTEIREQMRSHIKRAIDEQPVMLFMKGTPDEPRCGFSARVVAALDTLGADYAALDILPDPRIREELSTLSGWPTIPQLFVRGELVGGCDIVMEMFESGELGEALGVGEQNGATSQPLEAQAQEAPPIQIGD